ncbi:MAG: hypothetical protein EOP04_18805 [Proteobacteria bacterium]|nr:MAG: hypothetical protein EOP04_18805 [Pseudomonadota bacterium]
MALVSCFSFVACKQTKTREVKDFRLYVNSEDAELKAAIKELAAQYNKDVGANALTVVDNKSDANSNISFVENLADDNGAKLGLGQWITTAQAKNKYQASGATKEVTVYHSMALEFDTANFEGKLGGMKDKTSDEYKHLYHLFCHEVGHGMQLDHSEEKSNVMFRSIPDHYSRTIDFNGYFAYVRSYLNIAAPVASGDLI